MAVANAITINDSKGPGYIALDPVPLLKHLRNKGLPTSEVEKCNRFILPAGKEYGRGWILMRGRDVKEIYDKSIKNPNEIFDSADGTKTPHWNSFGHSLRFSPEGAANNEGILIERLAISHVQSVTGWNQDYIGDNNSADPALGEHFVIVEFVDARYVARMTKMSHQAVSGYSSSPDEFNVRSYDILKPDDTPAYVTHTLKQPVDGNNQPVGNRVPWTWAEVVDKLIAALPYQEFNPLPVNGRETTNTTNAIFPTETPQNLRFCGMSAWEALCEVLHQTGNTIWRDLKGNWHIESYQYAGTADGFLRREESYHKWLRDPGWDLPRKAATTRNIHIPEKLVVCFPSTRNYFDYGRTNDGSEHIHFIEKEKTLNSKGFPNTKLLLYSSTYADYDEAGNLLNNTALESIATDMVAAFKAAKGWETKSLHNVYNFYHNIPCGSGVSAVQWYSVTQGATTEILLNPLKYIPKGDSFDLASGHRDQILAWENFTLPDVVRKHNPTTRFIVCYALEDITGGNRGLAALLRGTHSGNSSISWGGTIPSDGDLPAYRDDPNNSGNVIYLHQPGGTKIHKGAKVLALWHVQTRRWIAAYIPCTTSFSIGLLKDDMCPNEQGVVYATASICSCGEADCGSGSWDFSLGNIITAENPYKLSGRAGRKVLMYHTPCLTRTIGSGSNSGMSENYEACVIMQVEHEAKEVVVGAGWDATGNCTPGEGEVYSCTLRAPMQEISVMTCKESYTYSNAITYYAQDALQDWWVSGNTIRGSIIKVWSPVTCLCDDTEKVLHIGTDCAYGSGSGG